MNYYNVAIAEAKAMYETGYRPPLKAKDIIVTGKGGVATFKAALMNMLAGGFISEHDFNIGTKVATILAGGEIEQGNIVSDEWLLELEYRFFMELLHTEKRNKESNTCLKWQTSQKLKGGINVKTSSRSYICTAVRTPVGKSSTWSL